ncbi:MAG: autotransporter-associated beta strand repeat-containing protein [Gemmataceae bacterium]|nr:autotransporter-associated beta strand repeat-containing protein [Gemmataceae bacterium]
MLTRRIGTLLAVATALLGFGQSGRAQTWVNYTGVGVNWSVGTNWSTGITPSSSATTVLTFSSVPTTLPPTTTTFQTVGNYSTTNDAATPFIVNQMIFDGYNAPTVGSNGVVISSSNAAGGFSFQGANPQITQNGTGSVNFSNGAATNDIQLTASGLTINGSGIGHVTFAGNIAGTGDLTINHLGTTPMFSGGQIFLSPGAASTFTGNINLVAGNLTLAATNSPLGATTNTLVVSGGTIRSTGGAVIVPNPVTLSSQMVLTGAVATTSNITFNGAIGGNGGIRGANTAAAVVYTFQNTISGTGAITADPLALGVTQMAFSSQSATLHGTALNASSYSFTNGALQISNTTANVARLNAMAPLTMNGSILFLGGSAAAATNETVGSTTLSGMNIFSVTPNAAQPMSMNFGALTLNSRATFQVTTQGTGLTLGGAPATNGNANVLFSATTVSDNVNGVLPYGFALIGTGTTGAFTLTRYDATNGVVPLNTTTDYDARHPYLVGNLSATNYRTAATVGGVNGTSTVNALLFETATGSTFGSGLFGTGTINLTSGVIGTSLTGGTTQPTMTGAFIQPNISLGGTTGYIHAGVNTVIQGNITGTNGLVKSGASTLQLNGDNSSLSGGLTVNGGNLVFSADNNLGVAGAGITLTGGTTGNVAGNLVFNPTNQYGPSTTTSLAVNRPITLGAAGGQVSVTLQGTTLQLDGTIGGSGRFVKFGAGTLKLTGTNNYTGDSILAGGATVVTSDANLGNGGNVVLAGGFLQNDATFSTNRNFLLTTSTNAFIMTNGADLTVNGNIGGNQTSLTFSKFGSGNLILTANNSINGPVVVGATTATRLPGSDFAQTGGTLTLSGTNGALAAAGAASGTVGYTFNLGTTVHLDNSTAVNQNRLSSSQVNMQGAELKLTGNDTATMYEHIGVATSAGLTINTLGNTVTLKQPASVGNNLSTNLIATSYASAGSASVLFRGTNLGNPAAGDHTRVIFPTAPTLVNTLLPGAFYADSPTAAAQDFATYAGSTNGVERFTGYVALPASGSSNGTTYSHTGSLTLTGATSVNALKLNNGTIDMGANNIAMATTTAQAGLLLSTGTADQIGTSAAGVIDLAFGSQAARISVANELSIGSVANPVRLTTSGGLNKSGPGTLLLSSSNVTGGGYQVSGGVLKLMTAAAYSGGQTVTIAPGATLDTNDLGSVASPLGNFALQGFGTVKIGTGAVSLGAAAASYGGAFQGSGTILTNGTTATTLNGNSPNFSGDVRVTTGNLVLDANVNPTSLTSPGPLGTGTSAIILGAAAASPALQITPNVTLVARDITLGGTGTPVIGSSVSTGTQQATFSGTITLTGQTLQISVGIATGSTPGNGAVTFSGPITGTGLTTPGSFAVTLNSGNINLWGANDYVGDTRLFTYTRAVIGLGTNTPFGASTNNLVSNSTFSGTFRADNGARTIANPMDFSTTGVTVGYIGINDMTWTGTMTLNTATRTFDVTSAGTTTFSGNINGTTGSLFKNGGGMMVLSGTASNFTGGVTVNAGTLGFGSNSVGGPGTVTAGPIGTGTLTLSSGGTTLRAVGGPRTVDNAVTVNGNFAVDGTNALTLGGAMNLGTTVKQVITTNTAQTTFSGQIAATAGGINKDGPGVLNLTGDNLYTGGTTVTAGTLRVNNTAGSGTGTNTVTVLTGATLGGTGTIAGATTNQLGSILSPGNSVGKLNFGSTLGLNTGSTYVWEMNGYTPVDAGGVNNGLSTDLANHDQAGVTGTFTGGNFNLKISELGTPTFTVGQTYSWTIATSAGTPTVGTVGFDLSAAPTFNAFGGASALSVTVALGQVNLNFTPVPEPATILGLSAGAFAVGGMIRRRFKKATAV